MQGMQEGFLDSDGEGALVLCRFVQICEERRGEVRRGEGGIVGRELKGVKGRGVKSDRRTTYLVTCPSSNRREFICERRSGSCVVGVYVDAAFGTRTGVVGSSAIVRSEFR